MLTFKEEIKNISKNVKVRGKKSNFSILNWNIDYFRNKAREVLRENENISEEELIKEVKRRTHDIVERYSVIMICISQMQSFLISNYFEYNKYVKNEEMMQKYLNIDSWKKSEEFLDSFGNLFNNFAEILRGDLGVNSAKTFYETVEKEYFRRSFVFPYELPKIINNKSRNEKIREVMRKVAGSTEGSLKNLLVLSLMIFGYFVEEFGVYEKYLAHSKNTLCEFLLEDFIIQKGKGKILRLKTYEKVCEQIKNENHEIYLDNIDIAECMKEIEEFKVSKFPEKITFLDLFNPSYLKSLDLPALMLLNAFWQSKFSKEFKNLLAIDIIADAFDLYTGIFSDRITYRNLYTYVDDDDFRKCIAKSQYLISYCKKKMSLCAEDINLLFKYEINEKYESKEIFDNMDYEEYFQEFANQHTLFHDVSNAMVYYRGVEATYYIKNICFFSLIKMLQENKISKNYGIFNLNVPGSDKCIVCIDYPKMTFPVSFHIRKKELIDFMQKEMHNTAMPIYKGKDDLGIDGINLTTSILMPMSKEFSDKLKNLSKNINEKSKRYKLIKHLCMLSNGKVPDHFKSAKSSGEKVVIHEYIDLLSEIVFSDKKGSFYKREDFICN